MHSIEQHSEHPITHMARRWGTWASVVPRPPTVNSGAWRSPLPKTKARSASNCCWWCSAHQAVARGARGTGSSLRCPRRRNRHAFSAPGSRHCHATTTLLCWTSPMAKWTAQAQTTTCFARCFGSFQRERPVCGHKCRVYCEHCGPRLGRRFRCAGTVRTGFVRGLHDHEIGVHSRHQHILALLELNGHARHSLAQQRN